jgi:hypothetical protein
MTDEPAQLRRAMSREYCKRLRTLLTPDQLADLVARVDDPDRESRCASERYGIDSGALMRDVWKAVSGDQCAEQDFNIDAPWVDGCFIRHHFNGAFFWNKQMGYWPDA